jgi:hypothetical protein
VNSLDVANGQEYNKSEGRVKVISHVANEERQSCRDFWMLEAGLGGIILPHIRACDSGLTAFIWAALGPIAVLRPVDLRMSM